MSVSNSKLIYFKPYCKRVNLVSFSMSLPFTIQIFLLILLQGPAEVMRETKGTVSKETKFKKG